MSLQGTFGGNFNIFAANGDSTAWVRLYQSRSRPICLVALFNFFSTTIDPRECGQWLCSGKRTLDISLS